MSLGKLTATIAVVCQWIDETKTWNTTDFDGLSEVWLPQCTLWVPNLYLHTVMSGDDKLLSNGGSTSEVKVQSDGTVSVLLHLAVDIVCESHVQKYPFDTHECLMGISTNRPKTQTRLVTNDHVAMGYTENNTRWQVLSWSNELDNLSSNYSWLTHTVKFRRYSLFLSLNLIVPVIILAALNPLVFLLPEGSGERIGLSSTIFLSLIVFVSNIASNLPAVADPISYINIFLLLRVSYSAFIILCVIILSWMKHNNRARIVRLTANKNGSKSFGDVKKNGLQHEEKPEKDPSGGNIFCFALFGGFTVAEIVLWVALTVT